MQREGGHAHVAVRRRGRCERRRQTGELTRADDDEVEHDWQRCASSSPFERKCRSVSRYRVSLGQSEAPRLVRKAKAAKKIVAAPSLSNLMGFGKLRRSSKQRSLKDGASHG